jgi:hypothetical protein
VKLRMIKMSLIVVGISALLAAVPYAPSAASQVRMSATQTTSGAISYRNVAAVSPASSVSSCPSGAFCMWKGKGFTGAFEKFNVAGGGWYAKIAGFAPILSYKNQTGVRIWLNENNSHTNPGHEYCMNPVTATPHAAADITGPWDTDGWLWISTNLNPC